MMMNDDSNLGLWNCAELGVPDTLLAGAGGFFVGVVPTPWNIFVFHAN